MGEKGSKKTGIIKIVAFICLVGIILAGGYFLAAFKFFDARFYPNTHINGIDTSMPFICVLG